MKEKKKNKGIIFLVILLMLALLLGSIGTAGFFQKPLKGIQGEQGEQGLQGLPGEKGEKGIQGKPGEQGLQGEKGEKGDRGSSGGSGPRGATGPAGSDGKDCPINEIANVTSFNSTCHFWYIFEPVCHNKKYFYHFDLSVNVTDPEDDNMHISFYYAEDYLTGIFYPDDIVWTKIVEYIGGNSIYSASVEWSNYVLWTNQTILWLVETWDGSDIGLNYFESCPVEIYT